MIMEQGRIVAMISGHLYITESDFNKYYAPMIDEAIENNHYFIMGDARGVDFKALDYLVKKNVPKERITVYYQNNSWGVKGYDEEYFNVVKGNYRSLEERDARMTSESHYDIAWVRSKEESKALYGDKYDPKRISATQKNIERRREKYFC